MPTAQPVAPVQPEPPQAVAPATAVPATGVKTNKPPFDLPKSFSATVRVAQGSTVSEMKFFASDNKLRLETKTRDFPVVLIADLKEMSSKMLVPDRSIYIVRALTPSNAAALDLRKAWQDPTLIWERKPDSIVEGVPCEVYHVTSGREGDPTYQTHDLFLNPATQLPLKVVIKTPKTEITQLWTNVTPGPQDAALFTEPAGYTEKQN
ncbi:hypothetical protein DB346_07050 [Verrucomicrobia bacterium LW23]|nr:hypothetical protein DB346_07050 [Verrucomicrobia bacterium LW23]